MSVYTTGPQVQDEWSTGAGILFLCNLGGKTPKSHSPSFFRNINSNVIRTYWHFVSYVRTIRLLRAVSRVALSYRYKLVSFPVEFPHEQRDSHSQHVVVYIHMYVCIARNACRCTSTPPLLPSSSKGSLIQNVTLCHIICGTGGPWG